MSAVIGSKKSNSLLTEKVTDRRGIKLVSKKENTTPRRTFRIDISEELLCEPRIPSKSVDRESKLVSREMTLQSASDGNAALGSCETIFSRSKAAVGLAVIGGLIIGYLVGRRQDG